MLIDFSVTNFRSIRDKQTFSMVKAKNKGLEGNYFNTSTPKPITLLKSGVVYGANGSGKSNLVDVLKVMGNVMEYSGRGSGKSQLPSITGFNQGKEKDTPTEFDVVFVADGTIYQYGFCVLRGQVTEEWLFADYTGKSMFSLLFSRELNTTTQEYEYKFGRKFKKNKSTWIRAARPDALFLSAAVGYSCEQLKPIYDWFINLNESNPVDISKADHLESATLDVKSWVLKMLQVVDYTVDDIEIKLGSQGVNEVFITRETSDGDKVYCHVNRESKGVNKIIRLAGQIYKALRIGSVLVVDDLSENLHPNVVKYIVEVFHDETLNPRNAQLVFTTHDATLLNREVFRHDQVWFCDKDSKLATSVFSLAEFKDVKYDTGYILGVGYLGGRYGATPFIPCI